MDSIITALILGLSVERLFICPCFTFALALSDKSAAVRFLLGRILGIITLGLLFTLIGFKAFPVSKDTINIIFGIIVIFFGVMIFSKKPGGGHSKLSGQGSFCLGLFRGMLNPGKKMFILFPLLIGVSIPKGMAITTSYALSSSFYLILGFMGGEFLNRILSYRRAIKIAGAMILIAMGIFYILRGLGLFGMGRGI
jgi:cytochrome c biogenesis protein CcdA